MDISIFISKKSDDDGLLSHQRDTVVRVYDVARPMLNRPFALDYNGEGPCAMTFVYARKSIKTFWVVSDVTLTLIMFKDCAQVLLHIIRALNFGNEHLL